MLNNKTKSQEATNQALAEQTLAKQALAKQMLEVWGKRIQSSQEALTLTKKRMLTLNVLFSTVFHNELPRWEAFVDKIASSEFAKSISLDWAITPKNCITILSNGTELQLTPAEVAEIADGLYEADEDKDEDEANEPRI